MEDSSIVSKSNANTIQRNPLLHSHKVATVLRNRSSIFRDREILSKSKSLLCFLYSRESFIIVNYESVAYN